MLFFPYKVDLDLKRLPVITLLVVLICITVFVLQIKSNLAVNKAAIQFCAKSLEGSIGFVLHKVAGGHGLEHCVTVISTIHHSNRPDKVILSFAENAEMVTVLRRKDSVQFIAESLQTLYSSFKADAPASLTAQLIYDPRSFQVNKMISAAFSHGGWAHLIGNLFFFFAFAASVEILIGSLAFAGVIVFLAAATNLTYSLAMLNNVIALPTLGLSGVVMGMIGLFTFLLPKAKIRCFFWFIIIVRILSIPAWILAAWYIGWDAYNLYTSQGQSNINLIVHVSGAGFGVLLGLLFFRGSRPSSRRNLRLT